MLLFFISLFPWISVHLFCLSLISYYVLLPLKLRWLPVFPYHWPRTDSIYLHIPLTVGLVVPVPFVGVPYWYRLLQNKVSTPFTLRLNLLLFTSVITFCVNYNGHFKNSNSYTVVIWFFWTNSQVKKTQKRVFYITLVTKTTSTRCMKFNNINKMYEVYWYKHDYDLDCPKYPFDFHCKSFLSLRTLGLDPKRTWVPEQIRISPFICPYPEL